MEALEGPDPGTTNFEKSLQAPLHDHMYNNLSQVFTCVQLGMWQNSVQMVRQKEKCKCIIFLITIIFYSIFVI